jgi:integrase
MVSKAARITTELVEKLQPGDTVMDRELSGFMVRRQKGEARIYAVRKFANGKRHFETIGEHGRNGWTETRARKKAVIIIAALHGGQDPTAERARSAEMPTLADWAQTYLAGRAQKLKPKTKASYGSILNNQLAPRDENGKMMPGCLGGRKLDAITRRDVELLHGKLEHQPRTGNLTVVFLSALFTKAQLAGLLPEGKRHNPAYKIEKFRERKRERFLTAEELGRLGEAIVAAEAKENPYALAALRLLILTGARHNEILTLRWKDIDFERGQVLLGDHKSQTTSRSSTKTIHLSPAALAVIAGLRRVEGNPYVIVGEREGHHLVNLRKTWVRIRDAAKLEANILPDGKVEPVRIHDLRHSFASALTSNDGANLMLIGKLLGHSNPSTTQRYAHLLPDQIKQHNDLAGERIAAALAGKATRPTDQSTLSPSEPPAAELLTTLVNALGQLPQSERDKVVTAIADVSGANHSEEDIASAELAIAFEGLAKALRSQPKPKKPMA